MRNLLFLLSIALLAAGCNEEVCRNCAEIAFDYESFEPSINDDVLRFTRVADGSTVEFVLNRNTVTPASEICDRNADEEVDISCNAAAESLYINEDLGIDMSINFTEIIAGQRGVPTQVIQNFSFKGRSSSDFIRTHAVVLTPQIVLQDDLVELRDSLTVGGTLYTEVIELQQPPIAFQGVDDLPNTGRFVRINIKEGVGLLRLVDVDGNVYARDFD